MIRRPALRLCLAFLMAATACDCGDGDEVPDGGALSDGGQLGLFGAPCSTSTECASGLCLGSGICSSTCQAASDCPAFEPWACTDVGGQPRCTCTVASAQDACNLADDDCNGLVDDGPPCSGGLACTNGVCGCPQERQCGATCVDLQNDVAHCGACDNECEVGSACVEGQCTCAGETCNGACVDPQSDAKNCGACGTTCLSYQECAGGECQATDLEWARWAIMGANPLVSEGDEVRDRTTGLLWEKVALYDARTWAEARTYCGERNDPDVDGTGDNVASPARPWRLPTRIELLSIVDYTRHTPALSVAAFPGEGPQGGPFWSATTDAADEARGWVVNFDLGVPDTFSKAAKQFVRCVK